MAGSATFTSSIWRPSPQRGLQRAAFIASHLAHQPTVNKHRERDQVLGPPHRNSTDEGHIIHPQSIGVAPLRRQGSPRCARKLGAWVLAGDAEPGRSAQGAPEQMLSHDRVVDLACRLPPHESGEGSRASRNQSGAEGADAVARARSLQVQRRRLIRSEVGWKSLVRAVPPELYLSMAMTEPEEKAERYSV